VFAFLPSLYDMQLYYIVICGLSDSTIFFHIISQMAPILEKLYENEMYVMIFCTCFVQNISHSKKNSVRYYNKCTYIFL